MPSYILSSFTQEVRDIETLTLANYLVSSSALSPCILILLLSLPCFVPQNADSCTLYAPGFLISWLPIDQ